MRIIALLLAGALAAVTPLAARDAPAGDIPAKVKVRTSGYDDVKREATVRFLLPTVNHVSQPGHRVMAQVPSPPFPRYDRNPQAYVPNIFAKPANYRKPTITLHRGGVAASAVWLPVVPVDQSTATVRR